MPNTSAHTLRRATAILAVNILLFLVLLIGLDLVLRWHIPKADFFERTYPGEHQNTHRTWARPDPDLGWVFSGKNTDRFTNETLRRIQFDYRANAQGFRTAPDFDALDADSDKTRIMMLGDSFVFGVYLNEADTLPHIIQDKLGAGYETYNLGIPGWGIDQMYWAYKKYADLIRPDIVVLGFIDEDIDRVFEAFRKPEDLNKPSYHLMDGSLAFRKPSERTFLERSARTSLSFNLLYRHGYRVYASTEIAKAIMTELLQESRRRGEKLVVVRFPERDAIFEPRLDWRSTISRVFAGSDIAYLDPREAMRGLGLEKVRSLYLINDSHPSGEGNAFTADYIIEHALRRAGVDRDRL